MMIKEGYTLELKNDLPVGTRMIQKGTVMYVISINGDCINVQVPGLGAGGFSEKEAFNLFIVKDNDNNIVTKASIMSNIRNLFSLK